jgi:hypothetical protein
VRFASAKLALYAWERRLRFQGVEANFTRLHAYIVQEDGAFTVSIRLHNHLNESESACGEEIAATFELASSMVDALATRFEIEQTCISISIVMQQFRDGTFH